MGAEREHLLAFNGLYKESDEIYRNAAKTVGLSDCAFWIFYFLRETGRELKQSDLCSGICAPKQTVNSALKKLEEDGYIELKVGTDRRSRFVRLTQKGMDFAAGTVDRVFAAELGAMGAMTAKEQTLFLGLFRKYTDLLKREMGGLEK